jgi:ATP-dependent RNA helicase SUPV3L1/SUV3
MPLRSLPLNLRSGGVTAILGPTNTGKTHLAIERMVAHPTGMIGLPLRLLAREVYGRVVAKVGPDAVALVTGEEKIKPERPRFWVCTAEAMPRDFKVDFVAVDEIQLSADMDRGHIFTDRLLNQRGRAETMLLGSSIMRPLIERLVPDAQIVTRPRLSKLTFAGEKKLSRLPRRTAIIAFSAEEVYAVAELIRRQKGGAAVVLGALSPRTRNAQVDLYQNGDVDYLIATDAIGMGLNLDVDHVAFASDRKFDGNRFRRLMPAEMAQVAGRAGRHLRDGTFGTSGRCPPFEDELVEAIENHVFEPARHAQWRNPDLDFASLVALQASLNIQPDEAGLVRANAADDEIVLDVLSKDEDVVKVARGRANIMRLWEFCQLPDYRKVSPGQHAELVGQLYLSLMKHQRLPVDGFKAQIDSLDRVDGDIDTLSARLAQVRTWSFIANRPNWLADPEHWQGVARQLEDRLSDALHERLASRFVDRRTSVLMRRLRENTMLEAIVSPTGDVTVEGQHVGSLQGFRFTPDAGVQGAEAKALNAAATKALVVEISQLATRLSLAADEALILSNDGFIRWGGEPVGRLIAGETILAPQIKLVSDEQLTGPARELVEARLTSWFKTLLTKQLGPLVALENPDDLTGAARGIGFQLSETLGVLERSRVADEVKGLDQDARAALRKHGIRFGAYHLYLPTLMKPAPRALAAQLWALKHGGPEVKGLAEITHLSASGRTTIPVDKEASKALYRVLGFRVCGERAVRVDILERLADLIRPAATYRPGQTFGVPPAGTADGDGFVITGAMTSLLGCSGEDFAAILRSIGYVSQSRPAPAITVALAVMAATVPAVTVVAPEEIGAEAVNDTANVAEFAQDLSELAVEHAVVSESSAVETAIPVLVADELAPAEPEGAEASELVQAIAAETNGSAPEIVLIEVWRQQRFDRSRNDRSHPQRQRGGARSAGGTGDAPSAGDAPQADGARPSRPHFRRGPPRSADGANPAVAGEGAKPWQGRRDRSEGGADSRGGRSGPAPNRAEGERPAGRGGRPEFNKSEAGKPRRDGDRGPRGPRPDRDNAHGSQARQWHSDAPRKDTGQPDLNSPFAKLMALKAQLEGKDKS